MSAKADRYAILERKHQEATDRARTLADEMAVLRSAPAFEASQSAPQRILALLDAQPHGTVLSRAVILACVEMEMENVDKTLQRLLARGVITRISRNLYTSKTP